MGEVEDPGWGNGGGGAEVEFVLGFEHAGEVFEVEGGGSPFDAEEGGEGVCGEGILGSAFEAEEDGFWWGEVVALEEGALVADFT